MPSPARAPLIVAVALAVVSLCPLVGRASPAARKPQQDPPAPRPSLAAARVEGDIAVDGRLDEQAWSASGVASDFLQRDPDEGHDASERTEVRVLFDDEAIYVGARMYDRDPAAIARRLTRRDQNSDGLADAISVYLDPHHDHLTGAAFSVTAAGTQSDAALSNDSGWDGTWDAVWASAVTIDEEGWTAELRVPLSQLRFEAGWDVTWGLQVVRDLPRRAEESMWSLVGRNESGRVSRMGHLTGLELRGSRYLQLVPYTTLRGETTGAPAEGDPFARAASGAAAVGADHQPRPNLFLYFVLTASDDPDDFALCAFAFPQQVGHGEVLPAGHGRKAQRGIPQTGIEAGAVHRVGIIAPLNFGQRDRHLHAG